MNRHEEGASHNLVPSPAAIAVGATNAKEKVVGGTPTVKHDKTKVPVDSNVN